MKSGSTAAQRILKKASMVIKSRGQKLEPAVAEMSLSLDEESVYAVVAGGKLYEVEISPHHHSCQCAYFQKNNQICKHMAALAYRVLGADYQNPQDTLDSDDDFQKSISELMGKKQTRPVKKSLQIDQLKTLKGLSGLMAGSDMLKELPELYFQLNFFESEQIPSWKLQVYTSKELENPIDTTPIIKGHRWPQEILGRLKFVQKSWEIKHWSAHVPDKIRELFHRFDPAKESQIYAPNGKLINFSLENIQFRIRVEEEGDFLKTSPYLRSSQGDFDIPSEAALLTDTSAAILIGQNLSRLDIPFLDSNLVHQYQNIQLVDEFDREKFLWEIQNWDLSFVDIPDKFQLQTLDLKPEFAALISKKLQGIDLTLGYVYDKEHYRVLHNNPSHKEIFYKDGAFCEVHRDPELEAKVKSHFESVLKDCFNTKEYKRIARESWYGEYFFQLDFLARFAQDVLPRINTEHFENLEILDPYRITEAEVEINLSSGMDWFELHGQVQFGNEKMSLLELFKKMYLEGKEHFVQLQDGSKGLIPEELIALLERVQALGGKDLKSGLASEAEANAEDAPFDVLKISKHQGSLVQELYELECVKVKDRDTWKSQLKNFALKAPRKLKTPKTIKATLRPYQEEGVHWLRTMEQWGTGGILADDMGLGKTLQVITLIEHLASSRQNPILIVLPTSLLFNWKKEFEKFLPKQKVLTYYGSTRKQDLQDSWEDPSAVILTSYQLMQRDINELLHVQFDYVILDESQAIKNPTTKTHRAARLLKGRRRLAMTGTPVENNLLDLWSQFDFLNPGFLGTKKFFVEHFMKPIQEKKLKSRSLSLQALVQPFYLRRTKEVVLKDLPPKQDVITWVQFDESQRKYYNQLKKKYRDELLEKLAADGPNKTRVKVLEGLLRLRQVCCDPRLVDPETNIPSAKVQVLLDKLREDVVENHKALVFSQFTSLLKLVGQDLEKEGYEYCYLDGSTKDRESVIETFQTQKSKKIFLISLKAGGVGLNLTQADYVFHLDPWWNPSAEDQATARAHRMGQDNTVMNYKLIATDSVEEKILELQQSKRNLSDEILNSDAGMISQLDAAVIEKLFS